jgi:citrate synthase
MNSKTENFAEAAAEYWSTSIINIRPGSIEARGYPIEQLIGNVGFAEMIWLMVRGERPPRAHADLLEAALVASVDHGPHAPRSRSRAWPSVAACRSTARWRRR